MGRPNCIKTAPIPVLEASVSTTKELEKSGKAKTGVVVKASFNWAKRLISGQRPDHFVGFG